jgi:hypothetical protein
VGTVRKIIIETVEKMRIKDQTWAADCPHEEMLSEKEPMMA